MVNVFFFLSLTEPDEVILLSLTTPENNEIKVTCGPPKKLNGPHKTYRARLYPSGYPQDFLEPKPKKNCDFVFKDLSYSTTYTVEVCIIHVFGDTK